MTRSLIIPPPRLPLERQTAGTVTQCEVTPKDIDWFYYQLHHRRSYSDDEEDEIIPPPPKTQLLFRCYSAPASTFDLMTTHGTLGVAR